jgi:DNA polymerase-3 subunit delta'
VTALYADVSAQPAAVAALRAAARRPVHAYLFLGPPGTGRMAAARSFAAELLGGGDPQVEQRVLDGVHPDLVVVEREGRAISVDMAHDVARLAARSPVEGRRKVLMLTDFHLVADAGPALLKTIEEPPPSVVFVILAEHLPPELVTIASRCVQVEFRPLRTEDVVAALVAEGVDPGTAAELADAAGGRLDRARLLATDPGFAGRRQAWLGVPGRLDGTGATVAAVADELVALQEDAVTALRARQDGEVAALEARNARAAEVDGKVGRAARSGLKAGVRELEERHRRELRRLRTDELRSGLAVLAGAYRDRLGGRPADTEAALRAIVVLQRAAEDLASNPGESLFVQALLTRLGRSPVG